MNSSLLILGARAILPTRVLESAFPRIESGRIASIGTDATGISAEGAGVIDARGHGVAREFARRRRDEGIGGGRRLAGWDRSGMTRNL